MSDPDIIEAAARALDEETAAFVELLRHYAKLLGGEMPGVMNKAADMIEAARHDLAMTDPIIEAAMQVNPDLYVSEDRQEELIELASEAPATTVRQAIREAVAAALERAAKTFEDYYSTGHNREEIAAMIRALKEQPSQLVKQMSPENAAIYHGDIDGDFNY